MFNYKRVQFWLIVLLYLTVFSIGNALGSDSAYTSFLNNGNSLWASADIGAEQQNNEEVFYLAQADTEQKAEETNKAADSDVCKAFAADPDADIGEIVEAGCEPTTAQMSALMDNPLGNVAMLITQFDVYELENPDNGNTATQSVYTGIAQFPKKLSKDWNLINRLVWTVPSMPLDQDKIDQAGGGDFGQGPGQILPPNGSPPLPTNVFDGRTTGFGDMYYVALFSPNEGIKLDNGGNFVWGSWL